MKSYVEIAPKEQLPLVLTENSNLKKMEKSNL